VTIPAASLTFDIDRRASRELAEDNENCECLLKCSKLIKYAPYTRFLL